MACFSLLKTLIVRSNFLSFFHVFQNRSRGKCLEGLGAELYWKLDLGAISDLRDFQKDSFSITFSHKALPKNSDRFIPDRSLPRPCFSPNHSNYCAVLTSWLLVKIILGWSLALFVFFLFFFVLFVIQRFYHFSIISQ